MKKILLFEFLLGVALLFSCNQFKDAEPGSNKHPNGSSGKRDLSGYSNQVVLDWNDAALRAMDGPGYQHVLLASRTNAMVHLAIHDALNGIAKRYATYALKRNDHQAEPIAAAASAAHTVLVTSFPQKKEMLDQQLAQSLVGIPEGKEKERGIALGKEAGNGILALRQGDGADQNPVSPLNNPLEPGVYQVVPPFDFVFAPHWATMKPFALERPEQFRCPPRPALTSPLYAESFNEVKAVGEKNSTVRTADQTAYAQFWYEFSEIGWNRVARTVAVDRKLDLLTSARLFALMNMALADAYTAGWDSKYHYNFWRPYTAIRAGETDGNAATAADANWEPLMPTPPVHDYPSTHSALGNAAAGVLAYILGDQTSFTMNSTTANPANSERSFTSFSQAANENADSRVMAGIHFRFSCQAGQELGNQVGKWTVEKHLRPLPGAAK